MPRVVIHVEFDEKRVSTCLTDDPEQYAAARLNTPVALLDEAYKTLRAELIDELGGE
jgi:hypothetical protein